MQITFQKCINCFSIMKNYINKYTITLPCMGGGHFPPLPSSFFGSEGSLALAPVSQSGRFLKQWIFFNTIITKSNKIKLLQLELLNPTKMTNNYSTTWWKTGAQNPPFNIWKFYWILFFSKNCLLRLFYILSLHNLFSFWIQKIIRSCFKQ